MLAIPIRYPFWHQNNRDGVGIRTKENGIVGYVSLGLSFGAWMFVSCCIVGISVDIHNTLQVQLWYQVVGRMALLTVMEETF
jgi:hypothetical protein